MLEEECHLLDLKLAQKTSPAPVDCKQYQHYSAVVHEQAQLGRESEQAGYTENLKNAITSLALLLTDSESNPMVIGQQEEAHSVTKKLESLVSHNCFCGWDSLECLILQDLKIANVKQKCKDGFPLEDGLFVMELDRTLAQLNVQ